VDFRVGQVHRVSKPMLMGSYSDLLNGYAILNNGGSEEYIVNHIFLDILYHVFGQDVFLQLTIEVFFYACFFLHYCRGLPWNYANNCRICLLWPHSAF